MRAFRIKKDLRGTIVMAERFIDPELMWFTLRTFRGSEKEKAYQVLNSLQIE